MRCSFLQLHLPTTIVICLYDKLCFACTQLSLLPLREMVVRSRAQLQACRPLMATLTSLRQSADHAVHHLPDRLPALPSGGLPKPNLPLSVVCQPSPNPSVVRLSKVRDWLSVSSSLLFHLFLILILIQVKPFLKHLDAFRSNWLALTW